MTMAHHHTAHIHGVTAAGDETTWSLTDWDWDSQAFVATPKAGTVPAAGAQCRASKRLRLEGACEQGMHCSITTCPFTCSSCSCEASFDVKSLYRQQQLCMPWHQGRQRRS